MSAGAFTSTFYELGSGAIAGIRVQPETLLASFTPGGVNAAATGPATIPTRARVSGGNRRYGVKARSVTIEFTGTPPTGYLAGSNITLPILTPAVYEAIVPDGTGTYLGAAIRVVGKSPERVK